MAEWPTVAEVKKWGALQLADDDANLTLARDAAVVRLTQLCLPFAAGEVPDDVKLAATMHSLRLWRRKDTPEGASAFGGDQGGGVIRHDTVDRDVMNLLKGNLYTPIGSA